MKLSEMKISVRTFIFIAVAYVLTISAPNMDAAISRGVGLAVAASSFQFNPIKDVAQGDDLENGVMAVGPYLLNGTTYDGLRGDAEHGAYVAQIEGGNDFYAITKADLTTSSVNFYFGFDATMVYIEAPSGNTNNVCIDWNGDTAACPAANTAGDDVFSTGTSYTVRGIINSVSAITSSGTETVIIRAFK